MYRIIPIDLTAAGRLTSSTISEPAPSETAWVALGTYTVGQERIRTSTHRVYKCVAGHAGSSTAPEDDAVNWLDVRPTLKWAPFDGATTAAAEAADTFTYVLQPGPCNAVSLHGLAGVSASISVKDAPGGTVVHTATASLYEPAWGWYEWIYGDLEQMPAYTFTGLPLHADPEITVTVTAAAGETAALGMLVVGHMRNVLDGTTWGGVEENASAEPVTRSYIETDEFGNTVIERRPASTNLTWSANCTVEMADAALSRLRRLLDVPAVWIADTGANYSGLVAFGLASGRVTYGPSTAKLQITVKGLF